MIGVRAVAVALAIGRALKGAEVVVETRGAAAIDRLRRETFSLVLCDLMMPEMDGEQFLEALDRELPAVAARVVFVTGGAVSPHKAAFLARHPTITKPVGALELRRLLAARLRTFDVSAP